MSKTISITIPEQLEVELQKQSEIIGLSRSRFICNLLLDWQKAELSVEHLPVSEEVQEEVQ